MPFVTGDAAALFNALTSHAMALAEFDAVGSHEPQNAPGKGINCSITLGPIGPAPSGLGSTSLRITFLVRLYKSLETRPLDPIDPDLLGATCVLVAAYNGDFTLGGEGTVRNIDVMAATASPVYLTQDGKDFRVMEITLPVIINDAFDQEATDG